MVQEPPHDPGRGEPSEETELTIPEALALAVQLHRDDHRLEAEPIYLAVLEAVPEHIDALNFLGVLAHQEGRSEEAERLIRRALDLAPDHPDAVNNLGNVLKDTGRLGEAEAAYRRVLELDPEHPGAMNNLGVVLKEQKRLDEAIETLQNLVRLRPNYADAHYNLGNALKRAGQVREAVESYFRAISIDPRRNESRRLLAYALHMLGRKNDAVKVLDDWLALEPDNPIALHLRAACSGEGVPDRASDRFVRQVFDDFAASFDERLKGLGYRAPELLADLVAEAIPNAAGDLRVLDVGCGTGLCGSLLRPYARKLAGVDLSPNMIARARERGAYDALEVAELTEYLVRARQEYDLMVSADTLVYFGPLEKVFEAAGGALRPGGLFAFTLERAESSQAPDGFLLHHHGRYSHSEAYVRRCLEEAGLEARVLRHAVLRLEAGKPVEGLVVLTGRPGPTARAKRPQPRPNGGRRRSQ